jgi:hypothetical protein
MKLFILTLTFIALTFVLLFTKTNSSPRHINGFFCRYDVMCAAYSQQGRKEKWVEYFGVET